MKPVKPVIARKYLPLCHRNTRLECVLTNAISKHRVLVVARANGCYFYQLFLFIIFSLVLTYREGVDMLREAGVEMNYDEDLR